MRSFVLDNTRLTTLDLLPSIRLRLADQLIPVWEGSKRDAPPFWAFAWAGGQALARYITDNPHLVRGRRVVDIASGCGIVAIVAAQCGAKEVIAAEIDAYSIEAIKINSELNGVEIETRLEDLLDGSVETDVILAGDVFYNRDMSTRVQDFLRRCRTDLILVGDPGRAYTPSHGFERVAEYDVPVTREIENTEIKRTVILRGLQGRI